MPLAQTIGLEQLSEYFHMPINEVAKELGVCATVLKKICRKNGIPRWPHRKIKSIDKMIKTLESTEAKKAEDEDKIKQEIATLRHKKLFLMKNPNVLMKPNKNITKQPKLTTPASAQTKIRVGGASLQHLLQNSEADVRRMTEETPEYSARKLLDVFASLQNKLTDQSDSPQFPQPPQPQQPQTLLAVPQHFGAPAAPQQQHFDIFAELNFQQTHASPMPQPASVFPHQLSALSQPSFSMLPQQPLIQPITSMTVPQSPVQPISMTPSTLSPQLPLSALSLPTPASFSLASPSLPSPRRPENNNNNDLNKSSCELPKINDLFFSPPSNNLKLAALEPTPALSSSFPAPLTTRLPPLRSLIN